MVIVCSVEKLKLEGLGLQCLSVASPNDLAHSDLLNEASGNVVVGVEVKQQRAVTGECSASASRSAVSIGEAAWIRPSSIVAMLPLPNCILIMGFGDVGDSNCLTFGD